MTFQVANGTLAASVADAGTFTLSYPSGSETGTFYKATGHKLVLGQEVLSSPNQFSIALGASTITVTNKSGASWAAGTAWRLQLEEQGKRAYRDDQTRNLLKRAYQAPTFLINLGAPDTADADGISASQSVSNGVAAALDGAVGATLDVPRAVVGAWTGTAIVTVTGTDEYGAVVVEKSSSGTSLTGKKAFKTITSIVPSADITAATFGTGDVLGLPVFLAETGFVVKELQDGTAPTAGTLVAGDVTSGGATATTGDVRGTYDPNAACDGAKVFQLIVSLSDPGNIGVAQFAG